MRVDPNQLSIPHISLRPLAQRTAPRETDNRPHVESTSNALPDGPGRVSQPIEIDNLRVRLQFKEDKETGIQVVQVIDPDSGEVVRQIPPEEILNITRALRDLKGLLVSRNS
jgi:flagellar protein FlaG